MTMSSMGRISYGFLRFNSLRPIARNYCAKNVPINFPLSKALPGCPSPRFNPAGREPGETTVATLDNGLRVATENTPGPFCTVGILIDSGSRYEVNNPNGIAHFLEKLAFGATEKFSSRDDILKSLEDVGGICDSQASRDTLIYAISASSRGAESAVEVLSQVTLRPRITAPELDASRQAILFELESLEQNPEPEPMMVDLIHAAAFRDNSLGFPKFAPVESAGTIQRTDILQYLRAYHTPERMVLAGAGIEHERLLELAQRHFLSKQPTWEKENVERVKPDLSIAQYTGGLVQVEKDMTVFATGPSPMPELIHAVIGLESCSHKDDDFIAFCVLQSLMGGGGSFSAGGPGKGMYTRLYLNVLNRCSFMWNATAQNHAYSDTGIFCIHASADPTYTRNMFEVIAKEIVGLLQGVSQVELSRAKKQLQSQLFMNLEFRPVVFEDIGRQVLAYNSRHTAAYYNEQIERISGEDIVRVARRMLQSPPSVAVLGDLSRVPNLDEIRTALSGNGAMPQKFTLFR